MLTATFWTLIGIVPLTLAGWALWWLERSRDKSTTDSAELNPMPSREDEHWVFDLSEGSLKISDLTLQTTGYGRDQVAKAPVEMLDLVHPEDRHEVSHTIRRLLVGRTAEAKLEYRLRFADDQDHRVQSRIIGHTDNRGKVQRLVGTLSDVTGRVSAEEERDRLFNLSIDMLAVWGFDGKLRQLNPAWVRVLGWSRDDLMDRPLLFFVHPEDQDTTREAFAAIFQGDPIEELDMRFRCRNGSYLWLSWSSFPYLDRQVVFSVVKDITHNKMAERKFLDYQKRLRNLSSQLSLVEDRQRKELAGAIHDGLAQQLFGIRAKLTLLKYPDKCPNLANVVQETTEIIDDTMNQARSLSFELFPPVLHEVGLEAALRWLGHSFQDRTGIIVHVSTDGTGPELTEDIRTMAFQSVRELLANTQKHSGSQECSISINHVDGFLTILVEDNGQGFDFNASRDRALENSATGGFGLFSIRERMRSIGGRMLVDSQPGRGCRISLTFPNEGSVFDASVHDSREP